MDANIKYLILSIDKTWSAFGYGSTKLSKDQVKRVLGYGIHKGYRMVSQITDNEINFVLNWDEYSFKEVDIIIKSTHLFRLGKKEECLSYLENEPNCNEDLERIIYDTFIETEPYSREEKQEIKEILKETNDQSDQTEMNQILKETDENKPLTLEEKLALKDKDLEKNPIKRCVLGDPDCTSCGS